MEKEPGTVPEEAKDSADDLSAVNDEQVDHSQSAPEDEDKPPGPSVGDAFRSGS